MAQDELRLGEVAESLRPRISQYAELVRGIAGANLRSLVLFGAAAAGSIDTSRQSVANVLVVGSVDLDMLRRLAEQGARLGKMGIAAPLIMTTDYIRDSLDAFPLELIEIQQKHAVVIGDDPFADIAFEDAHVRLQCERDLKALLIGLRQGMLAAAGRDKALAAVVSDVGVGLIRTMRGMLWLKGQKEAKPAVEVVAEMEKITDRKLSGVKGVLDSPDACGWPDFRALYHDVEAMAEAVDAW